MCVYQVNLPSPRVVRQVERHKIVEHLLPNRKVGQVRLIFFATKYSTQQTSPVTRHLHRTLFLD